jgi:hypothetical protein
MSQNDQVPAGTENYPVNNYIPKPNPNSRPKKFTKYAYVVKNQVVWDRTRRKYVVLEGKGKQETQPIPLLHKDRLKAYQDACNVCGWSSKNKEARTLYITDSTYISPTAIKRMREQP